MKHKRKELVQIQAALQNISAAKLSESAWEVVRNLKTVSKIIDEQNELIKKLYENCVDKDDKGNPMRFKEKAQDGTEVELSKITDGDRLKVYSDAVKQMEAEEHDITLIQVSKNAFKKLIDKGNLDLNNLVPLLDVMIPSDPKPATKEEEDKKEE